MFVCLNVLMIANVWGCECKPHLGERAKFGFQLCGAVPCANREFQICPPVGVKPLMNPSEQQSHTEGVQRTRCNCRDSKTPPLVRFH